MSKKWSYLENRNIRKFFSKGKKEKILKLIPNRSWDQIKSQAEYLRVYRFVKDKPKYSVENESYVNFYLEWSSEEDNLLRKYFSQKDKDFLLNTFKGRTWQQIIKRGNQLGLARHKKKIIEWTKREKLIILKDYPRTSRISLLKKLKGKNWEQIKRKASSLGVKRKIYDTIWTEEEKEILKEYYKNTLKKDLLNKIKNKDWSQIRTKAKSLNLYRDKTVLTRERETSRGREWTNNEIRTLIKYYPNSFISELKQRLPFHTEKSIQTKANLLGLKRDRQEIKQKELLLDVFA